MPLGEDNGMTSHLRTVLNAEPATPIVKDNVVPYKLAGFSLANYTLTLQSVHVAGLQQSAVVCCWCAVGLSFMVAFPDFLSAEVDIPALSDWFNTAIASKVLESFPTGIHMKNNSAFPSLDGFLHNMTSIKTFFA